MFYENLLKTCKERGTTPTTVAKALGISGGTLGQWKKGSSPTGKIVIRFADYLNVTTDSLLKGEPQLRSKNERDENEMFKTLVGRAEVESGLRALFDHYAEGLDNLPGSNIPINALYMDVENGSPGVNVIKKNLPDLIKNTDVTWERILEFIALAYNPTKIDATNEDVEAFFPSSLEFDDLMFKSRCTHPDAISLQKRLADEFQIALKRIQAQEAGIPLRRAN